MSSRLLLKSRDNYTNLMGFRVATRLENLMREVGFVDVESRMIQLPTCAWPTGPFHANSRLCSRIRDVFISSIT